MEPTEKRRLRQHNILLATGGLVLALLSILGVRLMGRTDFPLPRWWAVMGMTLAIQGALWLAVRRGWDERIPWDPHYVYIPMLAAGLQLNLYVPLVPQARYITLLVWFVALLFTAGLAGFRDVMTLSALMTAGYLAVLNRLMARGLSVWLEFEHSYAAAFFISSLYAGVVFERLRRERIEMKTLRRRLAQMAHTDPLTGLPNRRQFETILQAELAAIRRYGGQCAVAMIDVDWFKNYNDAHGHVAGDRLLRALAEVMAAQVRGSDLLARYGGEEFALIMSRTSKPEALRTLERLRATVEGHAFDNARLQPGGALTISAGVACSPEDSNDFDDLVRHADAALYAAKREGKNRVEAA